MNFSLKKLPFQNDFVLILIFKKKLIRSIYYSSRFILDLINI